MQANNRDGKLSTPIRARISFQDNQQQMQSPANPEQVSYFLQLLKNVTGENPLAHYAVAGTSFVLEGVEKIAGRSCYKIRLTTTPGYLVNYWIDAKNWHIIREVRAMQPTSRPGTDSFNGKLVIQYKDYQRTDQGYLMPAIIHVEGVGECSFKKIIVNPAPDTTVPAPIRSSTGKSINQ